MPLNAGVTEIKRAAHAGDTVKHSVLGAAHALWLAALCFAEFIPNEATE